MNLNGYRGILIRQMTKTEERETDPKEQTVCLFTNLQKASRSSGKTQKKTELLRVKWEAASLYPKWLISLYKTHSEKNKNKKKTVSFSCTVIPLLNKAMVV